MQLILETHSGRLVDSLSFNDRLISIDPTSGKYELYDASGLAVYAGTATISGSVLTTAQGDTIDVSTNTWTKSNITAPYIRIYGQITKNQSGNFVDSSGHFSMSATTLSYTDGAGNVLTATDEQGYYQTIFGRFAKIMDQSQQVTGLIFRSTYEIPQSSQVYHSDANTISDSQNSNANVFNLNTNDGSWQILTPLGNVRFSSDTMGVATLNGTVWSTPMGDSVDTSTMTLTPSVFGIFPYLYRTSANLVINQGNALGTGGFVMDVATGSYSAGNGLAPNRLPQGFSNGTFFINGGTVHLDSSSAATFSEGAPPVTRTYPQERDANISTNTFIYDDQGHLREISGLTKVEASGGITVTTHPDRYGVVTIDGSGIVPNFNDTALTGQTTAENIDVSGNAVLGETSASAINVSGTSTLGVTNVNGLLTISNEHLSITHTIYDGQESIPTSEHRPLNIVGIRVQ